MKGYEIKYVVILKSQREVYMIDFVIAGICIAVVLIVTVKGIKRMKSGESTGCGCGCKECSSNCHCETEKK